MTKKLSIVVIISILIVSLFTMQKQTNAAGITAEKIITSTDGSIEYVIKGLTLEEGANYQWAIEKAQNATIKNWYGMPVPDYSTGTVKISISSNNQEQLNVLKTTDTGYITIKKVDGDNILESYKVDLTLPLLKAFRVEKSSWYDKGDDNPAFEIYSIYGITADKVQFKWEKITDSNIVNKYIDNNHDLSGLKLKGKESFPSLSDTSWKSAHFLTEYDSFNQHRCEGKIKNRELPAEDGLYYLWLRGSNTNTKTVNGQAVVEVGTVTKIQSEQKLENENKTDDTNKTVNKTGATTSTSTDTSKKNTVANKATPNDSTISSSKVLPKAGKGLIVGIIFILCITAAVLYNRYKKYKIIK